MLNLFRLKKTPRPAPIFSRGKLCVYVWRPKDEDYRNFGDELSPLLAQRIAHLNGHDIQIRNPKQSEPKLLAVGSSVHQARDGDVVWGSGVNGKNWPTPLSVHCRVDVRAVRGPLTRETFRHFGIAAPKIYGDPGLLFPALFADEIAQERDAIARDYGNLDVIFIPNLNDEMYLPPAVDPAVKTVSPSETPFRMAQIISQASLVLSSSLHGIVFADALGVPCRPVQSAFEPPFKYMDYFAGTERGSIRLAADVKEALKHPDLPKGSWDGDAILRAFPLDLIASGGG